MKPKYLAEAGGLAILAAVSFVGAFYELWKTYPHHAFFYIVLGILFAFAALVSLLCFLHREQVHLHHYWLPVVFVRLFGLNSSYFLLILQAQAIAVHLHGISVYGVEVLFSKRSSKRTSKRAARLVTKNDV